MLRRLFVHLPHSEVNRKQGMLQKAAPLFSNSLWDKELYKKTTLNYGYCKHLAS